MQYSVPQFIEVEDKIIGPLTLKQFLILLFGGLILFFFYSLFSLSLFFFVLALPTIGFFAMLAFGKFNGRPFFTSLPDFLKFFTSAKLRIWKRVGEPSLVVSAKPEALLRAKTAPPEAAEAVTSRLKRLAYILDQKTAEEERLIHGGQLS